MSEPTSAPVPPAPPVRKNKGGGPTTATKVLLGLTVVGVVAFAASIGGVGYLLWTSGSGDVAEGSVLKVTLDPMISDAPTQGGLFADPNDAPPVTTEISDAIRSAAKDERITALYVDLQEPQFGMGSAKEIRDALATFRAAGKPCVAYSETYTNLSYYLASACDKVVLAPSGVNLVIGLNADITYYAGTLEMIGAKAEMLHVGDFKSAVEPYERTGPSEPAAEAYNYFLDGLYGVLVEDIAAGRGKTPDEIKALIDDPPMAPQDALARGMVDGLAFRDAVQARAGALKEEGWVASLDKAKEFDPDDEGAPKFTDLDEYLKDLRYQHASKDNQIAVVHAEGAIVSGDPEGGLFGDSALADRPFRRWMKEARENDAVKAVVLRVNSPGGSGLASDMMWREVQLTRESGKPVVVSMADYAASGGYFISAPADWIVAQPTTLTGSIGVFGGKVSLTGTYEKLGMTSHAFKRGANADLLAPSLFSEDGRRVYQSFLDRFYGSFLDKVAQGRKLDAWEQVHPIAQGRVWTGNQALERKLVDQLGGIDVALAKAAELAKIDDYGVTRLPRRKSFVDLLVEDLQGDKKAALRVDLDLGVPGADVALEDLMLLEQVLGDGGVAAMLPARIHVH